MTDMTQGKQDANLVSSRPRLKVGSGKGTPRRKKVSKPKSSGFDDKKLQATLKKIGVQPITGIEEVNMFKRTEGSIFSLPNVD